MTVEKRQCNWKVFLLLKSSHSTRKERRYGKIFPAVKILDKVVAKRIPTTCWNLIVILWRNSCTTVEMLTATFSEKLTFVANSIPDSKERHQKMCQNQCKTRYFSIESSSHFLALLFIALHHFSIFAVLCAVNKAFLK